MLAKIDALLDGRKTYLAAFAGSAVLVSVYFGWVPEELGNQILALLGFAGLAALRAGVANAE